MSQTPLFPPGLFKGIPAQHFVTYEVAYFDHGVMGPAYPLNDGPPPNSKVLYGPWEPVGTIIGGQLVCRRTVHVEG